ncbi:MAG: aldose 1-epimerase family protein [Spirochaetota bacterium]|nr:MAG: aldose 1-epimerase family protein [Spirochaetota bacterium]
MKINGKEYSRREIEKRIGNVNQIGNTVHYELTEGRSKGVRAVEFNNGSGLSFTVLPDRGLDIVHCTYNGINLVYQTPNGVAHPSFYEPHGPSWLKTFFGGLLTTCGLTYFGAPGKDGEEELGLHGRYSTLPASRVQDRSRWEKDRYILEISGTVEESTLFGNKLRLTRSISTEIGKRSLSLRDSVENYGFSASPFTILYHINIGFPLLDESSELVLTSKEIEPYDDGSKDNLENWSRFSLPVKDFKEQNFLHTMAGDSEGYAHAALLNRELAGGLGLFIRTSIDSLPFISEWKQMGEGDYVVGIEPCNTKIENRALLREHGRLPLLEPGEKEELTVEIGVLEGEEEIEDFIKKLKDTVASCRG